MSSKTKKNRPLNKKKFDKNKDKNKGKNKGKGKVKKTQIRNRKNVKNRGNKGNKGNKIQIKIPPTLFPEFHFTLFNKNDIQRKISNREFGLFDNYTTSVKLKLLDNYLYVATTMDVEKEKEMEKYFTKKQMSIVERTGYIISFTKNNIVGNLPQKYNINLKKGWTNAWRKIYEILERTNIVSKNNLELNHFDICGYPGAFIFGVNHYLKTRTSNQQYNWYIQSYREETNKERQYLHDIYGLHRKYPDKFLFGSPKTKYNGDITLVDNILAYYEIFKNNKLDLVTSDCGLPIEWSIAYKREIQMSKIFFGQLICSLMVLKSGGNLVMKTFTQFKPFSLSLIYLITQVFQTAYLVKPESSRQNTKEIYIMGKGYLGNLSKHNFNKLLKILAEFDNEQDINKSVFSYDKMDFKVVSNIESIIYNYYRNYTIKKKNILNKITYDYLDKYLDNPNKYLETLIGIDRGTMQERRKYFIKYFKRMNYTKIKKENQIM